MRKFVYTDDDAMLMNWIADENIQSNYAEPTYTTKEAVRELLNIYISSYASPDYYRWAIVLKENGQCIGQIAYFLVNSKNHFAEIEYCIGSKFQRKGFASEATKAIVAFGFNDIKLHKVQICHKSTNLKSKGVIEKIGFTYEGTVRDYFYINGSYVELLFYSILNSDLNG